MRATIVYNGTFHVIVTQST